MITSAQEMLARVVERTVLESHDGRSGSIIEKLRLDDGTRLVLKRTRPATDLVAQTCGGADRELALYESGRFDALPPGVGHALLGGWRDGDDVVLLMRDVAGAIPGWTRTLDRAESRRVLHAVAAVHRAFAGGPAVGLCPVGVRATALWPHRMRPLVGGTNPLPGLVLRGWRRFAELVPGPQADAVARLHADWTPLTTELDRRPATLLHGDGWLVNLALEPGAVTLLDWSMATWGPPLLDFAIFLTGAFTQVDASPEQLVADVRSAAGLDADEVDLMLLCGLMELGWNKALDAAEHPDPAVRAREEAELRWWLEKARPALTRLLAHRREESRAAPGGHSDRQERDVVAGGRPHARDQRPGRLDDGLSARAPDTVPLRGSGGEPAQQTLRVDGGAVDAGLGQAVGVEQQRVSRTKPHASAPDPRRDHRSHQHPAGRGGDELDGRGLRGVRRRP